jgi:hypothetical protein
MGDNDRKVLEDAERKVSEGAPSQSIAALMAKAARERAYRNLQQSQRVKAAQVRRLQHQNN